MEPLREFLPGMLIGGQFELAELLARGGMGTVYRAIQRGTQAERALKLMHPNLVRDRRSREMFLQEAQVSGRIRSDHVVHIIAAGVDDVLGVPWLAMELLKGVTLSAYIEQHGPLPVTDVLLVVQQIGHALDAAHQQGIIHRDLKPENVFLASSHRVGMRFVIKVLDFGVAKLLAQAHVDVHPVGTPGYMAPEQASDDEVDRVTPAADIWALGLIGFEMLVGRSYWRTSLRDGAHIAALWREILFDPIDLASERAADYKLEHLVPPRFDEWLVRCLSRDPRARFQHIQHAVHALADVLSAQPSDGQVMPVADDYETLTPTEPIHLPLIISDWGKDDLNQRARSSEPVAVTYRSGLERRAVKARPGVSLLEISRVNGIAHTSVCGGKARCTTCRVLIIEGAENLAPRTERETEVADDKRWPMNVRLACQARVLGPVTVRRLVLDAEDEALVSHERKRVTYADRVPACVLATATRGLGEFTRRGLPYDVIHIINRLIAQMRSVIDGNGGQVFRIVGPDIVAVFGHGEVDRARAAAAALRASLRLLSRIGTINEYSMMHFGVRVHMTVGLDDAEVMVGDVGGQVGHIFGEGVIVAQTGARAAARVGARIIASERFFRRIGDEVRATGQRLGARVSGEEMTLVEIADFRKPDALTLVQSAFVRIRSDPGAFARALYQRLWQLEPGCRRLFRNVDMQAQSHRLVHALGAVLTGFDNHEALRNSLRALARRHVGYGVKVGYYKAFGDALVGALEELLGSAFVPEMRLAWIDTYAAMARMMIEAHMQAADERSKRVHVKG